MNDQTLERLMMDDALGALDADTSELLAAYVEMLPDAGPQLRQWRQLASDARQVMDTDPAVTALQSVPRVSNLYLHPTRSWMAGGFGLAAAAMLLIGVGIGRITGNRPAFTPRPAVALVAPAPVPAPVAPGVEGFWSSRRLLATAQEQHDMHSGWKWTSPVNQPEIGGLR